MQPRDCQPAGNDAEGAAEEEDDEEVVDVLAGLVVVEGDVEDDDVVVEEDTAAVDDDAAVVEDDGAVVEDDGAVVEDDGAAVEDDGAAVEDDGVAVEAGMRASFWKTLILYPPPQTVFPSPPHLTLHPSVAGTRLTAEAGLHQHSVPYSTPAYGMPLAAQEEIQLCTVRLLEVYDPPPKARLLLVST